MLSINHNYIWYLLVLIISLNRPEEYVLTNLLSKGCHIKLDTYNVWLWI